MIVKASDYPSLRIFRDATVRETVKMSRELTRSLTLGARKQYFKPWRIPHSRAATVRESVRVFHSSFTERLAGSAEALFGSGYAGLGSAT